jgi:hypothetical protein
MQTAAASRMLHTWGWIYKSEQYLSSIYVAEMFPRKHRVNWKRVNQGLIYHEKWRQGDLEGYTYLFV